MNTAADCLSSPTSNLSIIPTGSPSELLASLVVK
ncbi:unnamed protein product, partial [Rotaria magnacalcarata]